MATFFSVWIDLLQDVTPWLFFGLLLAGFIKVWVPEHWVAGFLGGKGVKPIFWGAIIGAPLPLCSCSVIPMALSLRKQGASKGSTVSFLVATPETGVDSIAISWIMLGPWLTLMRPISAVLCAILAGLLTWWWQRLTPSPTIPEHASLSTPPNRVTLALSPAPLARDAGVQPLTLNEKTAQYNPMSTACGTACGCATAPTADQPQPFWQRLKQAIHYAFDDLLNDLLLWIFIGLLLAALVMVWVPPGTLGYLAGWGVLGMLAIMFMSVPIYVCATASTPLAAAMLHAGISPGMALVFLLTGPATSLVTLALVGRELGRSSLVTYLLGIGFGAIACGMATDALFAWMQWPLQLSLQESSGHSETGFVALLQWSSVVLFLGFSLRYGWKRLYA
ncbi:SO_0444 family Cu/Zn efflux transporter [Magnetococcus marinus]|uniref:SO_0444 family Cu/Zn efflux transporter n=1 Tax=Magnetococcus marinus TaxID=1124597 RepID=UPI00135F1711|nr:SO_0444 family Cu/Zn efflux transporter [Magnetococcus marinus]